ncbi:MAG: murein biosynthesis integral membrane protein MurJ [Candidatus Pacebacteria bacterium]|nr:murein biosynthesis integral membrane protein MurJ [Candidatus Paceibacterota bacterium]
MLKRFFSKPIHTITSAAALVALFSLFSRILGVVRDRVLAGQFGASEITDAYYAAFRVPDLLFNLIVLGALSAGFIPVFTKLIKDFSLSYQDSYRKNIKAWNLANSILNLMTLSLLALSVLGIIFAPELVKLVVPGFSASLQATTVKLTRIMFLSPIFLGISSVLGSVLQSYRKFLAYSLAPILYNLGIIFGIIYLVPLLGITGLAWGVVLGAFLHMLIQLPSAVFSGFFYRLKLSFKFEGVMRILKMMVPRTMALAVGQINLLVITIIASTLISGSLAVFNFANNLQSFAVGIFGISFAVAAFPTFSRLGNNNIKLVDSFLKTFRQILFFIIPSTVLLLTLRAQIIRVILGTGKFNWQDTILTIDTLGFFALSLFAQATISLLVRVFYAKEDSKTPFYSALIAMVINIILATYFSAIFGVAGLALAFSLSTVLNFLILWLILNWKLGSLYQKNLLLTIVKMSVAAILAGVVVQIAKVVIWPFIDMTTFKGVFLQGLGAGLAGLAFYLLLCYIFKVEEMFAIFSSLRRRLPWKKIETENSSQAREV